MSSNVKDFADLQLLSKEYLVCGYSRHHSTDIVPTDVLRMVHLYLQHVLMPIIAKWNFNKIEIAQLLSTENGCSVSSKKRYWKGIKMKMYLYPNGHNETDKGWLIFGVGIRKLPRFINNILINFSLKCNKSECNERLDITRNKRTMWWILNPIQISELHSLESLAVRCFLTPLRIGYKKDIVTFDEYFGYKKDIVTFDEYYINPIKECYINPIKISSIEKFEWNIINPLLSNIIKGSQCICSKVYGANNHCKITLEVSWVSGDIDIGTPHTDFGIILQILKLPINVSEITVDTVLSCSIDGGIENVFSDKDLHYSEYSRHSIGPAFWIVNQGDESFKLSITVSIKAVHDLNGNIIDNVDWIKFGIN
eukprot:229785_1